MAASTRSHSSSVNRRTLILTSYGSVFAALNLRARLARRQGQLADDA